MITLGLRHCIKATEGLIHHIYLRENTKEEIIKTVNLCEEQKHCEYV